MKLLAVVHHSPDHVKELLDSLAIEYKVLTCGSKAKISGKLLLVLTIQDLYANLDTLNKYKLPVIVFCSLVRAVELAPLTIIDSEGPENGSYKLKPVTKAGLKKALSVVKEQTPVTQTGEFVNLLLTKLQANSFLSLFQTFVYQCPASSQTEVSLAAFQYLVGERKSIPKTLLSRSKIKHQELIDLLSSPLALRYKQAFEYMLRSTGKKLTLTESEDKPENAKKSSKSYTKVKEKFAVDDYELKYIMGYLRKNKAQNLQQTGSIADEYYNRPRNKAKRIQARTVVDKKRSGKNQTTKTKSRAK